MRVVMITGDKRFGPGAQRYELQKSVVDDLAVIYWGRGSLWPALPRGVFDVVTAQDPFFRGLFGWYAAKRLGARLNVQVHVDLDSVGLVKHIVSRMVLRHAHSVRVVSQKLRNQMGKLAPGAQIAVLPIYVDLERFRGLTREPGASKEVLWIGRFEEEKDPLLALEVFKKIRAQGIEASLVMLGAGSLEPALRQAATSLPVSFPGWEDPLPYLARASVVLCTSKFESWGASMIEALAAGVPVVAPDVGIAREAGAIIKARSDLALGVVEALTSKAKGELQLHIPNKEEWVSRWKETLA